MSRNFFSSPRSVSQSTQSLISRSSSPRRENEGLLTNFSPPDLILFAWSGRYTPKNDDYKAQMEILQKMTKVPPAPRSGYNLAQVGGHEPAIPPPAGAWAGPWGAGSITLTTTPRPLTGPILSSDSCWDQYWLCQYTGWLHCSASVIQHSQW